MIAEQRGAAFDAYYKWLGIPPEKQPPCHYTLLALAPFEADREVIRNAASRVMSHLKTFAAGPCSEQSQQLLNQASAAKLCLLNPDKKRDYDKKLRRRDHHPAPLLLPPVVEPIAEPPLADRAPDAVRNHPLPLTRPHANSAPSPVLVRPLPPTHLKRPPRVQSSRPRRVRNCRRHWLVPAVLLLALLTPLALLMVRRVDLNRQTDTGTVKIEVNEPSAKVWIDENEVRIGEENQLRSGNHRLVVKTPSGVTITHRFHVRRGQAKDLSIQTPSISTSRHSDRSSTTRPPSAR